MITTIKKMRLHRTVLAEVEDRPAAKEACRRLHACFCEICKSKLLRDSSLYQRTWFTLFRHLPGLLSRLDYWRLKRMKHTLD